MTSTPTPAEAGAALLQLESVNKRYGRLEVTRDFSLQVRPGEALGIIGPNGAGKTTLMNLIGGDVAPDSGRIVFDGRDITALPPAARSFARQALHAFRLGLLHPASGAPMLWEIPL